MVLNHKLNPSLNALLTNLPTKIVRIFYMKKQPYALRGAIATMCWDYIPAQYYPRGTGIPKLQPHIVKYFEFNADGTPLGWRSFSKCAFLGWCDYVPSVDEVAIEPYSEPYEEIVDDNVNYE